MMRLSTQKIRSGTTKSTTTIQPQLLPTICTRWRKNLGNMNQGVQPDTEWEEDTSHAEDTGNVVFDPEVVQHRMLQKYPLTKKLWFKWPEFAEKVLRHTQKHIPNPSSNSQLTLIHSSHAGERQFDSESDDEVPLLEKEDIDIDRVQYITMDEAEAASEVHN